MVQPQWTYIVTIATNLTRRTGKNQRRITGFRSWKKISGYFRHKKWSYPKATLITPEALKILSWSERRDLNPRPLPSQEHFSILAWDIKQVRYTLSAFYKTFKMVFWRSCKVLSLSLVDDTKILYNSGREPPKAKRLLLPLPFWKEGRWRVWLLSSWSWFWSSRQGTLSW